MAFTPWGASDYQKTYAPGITFYGTPSHGGFKLSPERVEKIPAPLRGLSGYPDEWYEEDCCYAAVIYTFPDVFVGSAPGLYASVDEAKAQAAETLTRWYPKEFAAAQVAA